MSYQADARSVKMASFAIEGNIVDHTWSFFIKKKCKQEGLKTDPVAIALLAEIVYWFRPIVERDIQTGEIRLRKKYQGDLPQLSYTQLKDRTGYSEYQLKDAFVTLEKIEEIGVAKRVFRNIEVNGHKLSNVMYVDLNEELLMSLRMRWLNKESSVPHTCEPNGTHPPPMSQMAHTPEPNGAYKYRDYTENKNNNRPPEADCCFPSDREKAERPKEDDVTRTAKERVLIEAGVSASLAKKWGKQFANKSIEDFKNAIANAEYYEKSGDEKLRLICAGIKEGYKPPAQRGSPEDALKNKKFAEKILDSLDLQPGQVFDILSTRLDIGYHAPGGQDIKKIEWEEPGFTDKARRYLKHYKFRLKNG